jgi:ADP-ribosylglycohydrolase
MRVSPAGFARDSLDEVRAEAQRSAEVSHNHPEGIKGAQATACAIFLARTGNSKSYIKTYVEGQFGYDLSATLDSIRPSYRFDVSCQGSVPQSIIAFLESDSYEDAVRKAVSLGGDSDTMACIAGGIAEAFYGGVPHEIATMVWGEKLDSRLRGVVRQFYERYLPGKLPTLSG